MDIIEDQIKGGAALADSDTAYDEVNVTLKLTYYFSSSNTKQKVRFDPDSGSQLT